MNFARNISSLIMNLSLNLVIIITILLFTPGLPPNTRFENYKLTPPVALEGVFKPNNILDDAELFVSGELEGPESIAVRGNEVFTGVIGGKIIRIQKNGRIRTVAILNGDCGEAYWMEGIECGRPLGMRFDRHGKLVIADAYLGIYRVDVDSGSVSQLVSTDVEIEGVRPGIPNDLDMDSEGVIYWSDASTSTDLARSVVEFFGGATGRVIQTDPRTNTSIVLMQNVHIPNGVQLAKDQQSILVSESARSRVWRYFLKGERQGEREILLDGLPGLPDNIRPNGKGGYYVALCVYRDVMNPSVGDILGKMPLIRKLLLRIHGLIDITLTTLARITSSCSLIERIRFYVGHFGPFLDFSKLPGKVIIVEITESGEILRTLQNEKSEIRGISEVSVGSEFTYFGSFNEAKLWRIRNKILKKK